MHLPTEPDEREQLQLPASLPVGALCLIDNKPRGPSDFDSDDRQTLQGFAGLIARERQFSCQVLPMLVTDVNLAL